jgi:hypothetical protein
MIFLESHLRPLNGNDPQSGKLAQRCARPDDKPLIYQGLFAFWLAVSGNGRHREARKNHGTWNGIDLGPCLGEASVPSCGQATMMVSDGLKWLIKKGKMRRKSDTSMMVSERDFARGFEMKKRTQH